jgi:uncharacterized protein YuzE
MRKEAQFTIYNDSAQYMTVEATEYGLSILIYSQPGKVAGITFDNGREVLESLLAMQFPLLDALGHDTEKAHDPS